MSRLILSFLVLLLAVGCKSRQESARGAFRTPKPTFEAAASTNLRPIIDTPDPAIIDRPELLEKKAPDKSDERDLAAELQRAVGTPIDCLSEFESSTPRKIQIPIGATVRPTGMVIEPTVGGIGLSANDRKCIEQRMSFVKLQPLDKPFSQTVSTFLEFDYTPPVIVESDTPAPDPDLKNVESSMPKLPEVGPSGIPIDDSFRGWLEGGNVRHPDGPKMKKVSGPKPRAIDGYEVDESAQNWR